MPLAFSTLKKEKHNSGNLVRIVQTVNLGWNEMSPGFLGAPSSPFSIHLYWKVKGGKKHFQLVKKNVI
ncbi:Uncharacterized protein APZ42_016961 [Daphnia magna]|uniref:Uncharacterized protein n=1 Tax=Daphnia magna TaxID=35525 RepID=A0A165A9Z7_9CRUS|nr:Uncharacterized protein APZ42_016961 [Daphnia magna]